jgi:chromosome segregation ATPase
MPFASYFERISEIRTELSQLSETLALPKASLHDASARLTALGKSCRKLIEHMDELLEMATQPDVSLAQRLFLANCRIEELEKRVDDLTKNVSEERKRTTAAIKDKDKEIDGWVGKFGVARRHAEEEKRKNDELKRELQLRQDIASDPARAYGKGVKPLKRR